MLRLDNNTIIVVLAVGLVVAASILVFVLRVGGVDRFNVVPKVILWGQTVTVCAMWPMLEWDSPETSSYASRTRFEVGWLLTVTTAVVLMIGLWGYRRPVSAPARGLLIGIVGVMIAQHVSWRVAGDLLPLSWFVPMVVLAVGLTLFPLTFVESTRVLTQVLAVVCFSSVLAGVLGAQWAILEFRTLPSPLFGTSLGGLLMHPNQLAPVAGLGLALVLGSRQKWNVLFGSLFFVTLWWTESRTQIVAGGLVLFIWGARMISLRFGRRVALRVVGMCAGAAVVVGIGLRLLVNWKLPFRFVELSGREALWSQAIDYWQSSPLVGVGPEAFDRQWQRVTNSARGAHNEILQTLAAEGILGGIPLLVALTAFAVAIRRTSAEGRFTMILVGIFGLALIAMETPLRPQQSITGLGFIFVSVLVTLCASATTSVDGPFREADEAVTT